MYRIVSLILMDVNIEMILIVFLCCLRFLDSLGERKVSEDTHWVFGGGEVEAQGLFESKSQSDPQA